MTYELLIISSLYLHRNGFIQQAGWLQIIPESSCNSTASDVLKCYPWLGGRFPEDTCMAWELGNCSPDFQQKKHTHFIVASEIIYNFGIKIISIKSFQSWQWVLMCEGACIGWMLSLLNLQRWYNTIEMLSLWTTLL